jgi:hypothetical protein
VREAGEKGSGKRARSHGADRSAGDATVGVRIRIGEQIYQKASYQARNFSC